MDFDSAFAIGFLGIFVLTCIIYQVTRAWQRLRQPAARWLQRHVVLPTLFSGRHLINPTRGKVILLLVHWTVAGFYNVYQVHSVPDAASRAGRSALLHILPLLTPNHAFFVSYIFQSSLPTARFIHYTLGCMSVLQGVLHCLLHAFDQEWALSLSVFDITVLY